ncbi:MAG TPA: molecular chaperone DnaK [Methylomusa anaerophila]|uniref:Chaperone protein DnaK n=1 Tax=Methylomusa anaerophila TaxID=1930071 RepID=A0A348AHD3_9FIRM|nr:molecular chaperone DnaK [Methylomusa anaerophila]BBB90481.1 chaperone protein dnaK2 [Methylomusa anaerophila]HML89876.1 molecular chaperone DnaK [Methylomusa anaerophila]
MGKVVGIDLGTTNSVIAVLEGERPEVIANVEGGRTTPSVVAFRDNERLVGQLAKRQSVLNPGKTFYSVKRFIGRRFNEVSDEMKLVPYKVVQGSDDTLKFTVDDKQYAPEEISAQVLRKMVDDAGKYLGEKITDAVITVPAYFNDAQRQATKDAGRIAGLNVLRIINEPTAAALAYGLDKKKNETILVFDLGGGTFDVSILEVGDGVFEVKSTNGDTHLGGDDFDKAVVDWLAAEFKKDNGIDLLKDNQSLQRLTEAAEKAKIELSAVTETTINLPFITADGGGPKHLEAKLTRAKFDEITHSLVERCRIPVEKALADAKLSAKDIDEVILVGGSIRIPAVQRLVKALTGKDPNQSVNPDEVVAVGAAIQAGVLSGELKDVVLLDVTPLSLGIETLGSIMTKIIERNTTIPTRRSQVFSTAEDNQPEVEIHVLQGERDMAGDNRTLGRFKLTGIPLAPRGMPQIEVTFDIDANGILTVGAKDKASNKEQSITISGSSNLDKADIDRMVEDAKQYSEADKKRRQQIELKNEIDSLAYQARSFVTEKGETLPPHVSGRLTAALEAAKQAVDDNADMNKLRQVKEELEQAYSQACQCKPEEPRQNQMNDHGNESKRNDDVIDAEYE